MRIIICPNHYIRFVSAMVHMVWMMCFNRPISQLILKKIAAADIAVSLRQTKEKAKDRRGFKGEQNQVLSEMERLV